MVIIQQKQVLHDESSNSEGEPAKASEQIERIPKVVVIQEPPSIHVKQTYESSGKHKGIEVLFDVAQLKIDTLKAQKASRRERRFQVKELVLNQGESDDDSDKWGSTDEEVFRVAPRDENPKSLPSDFSNNDDQNEYEDDSDERVKTDDDCDDEEETDDKSSDIVETDDERTESDNEHQGKGDADMNIEQEVEKKNPEENPKGDDQATDAQPNDDNKDKFEFFQPTSNQSLSSGFENQFLLNSPNASLLGTINEPAEAPPPTPIAPPPATTKILATQVPNTKAISSVVQRFSEMEQFVKELKEADFGIIIHDSIKSQVSSIVEKYLGSSLPDAFRKELQANNAELKKELSELNYKEVIEELVKAHVVSRVKKFLPQFLPKAVSDFATPMIEESVKAHVVNEDVIEESVKACVVNEVKNFLP
ncbi:hypothetical protein Tco_0965330 [Tanacetum coccineum]